MLFSLYGIHITLDTHDMARHMALTPHVIQMTFLSHGTDIT